MKDWIIEHVIEYFTSAIMSANAESKAPAASFPSQQLDNHNNTKQVQKQRRL